MGSMDLFTVCRKRGAAISAAVLIALLTACGSDSTGPAPSPLSSEAALQSLALGLGSLSGTAVPLSTLLPSAGSGEAQLDQVEVNINGKAVSMFALGWRVTFPAGTCEETLFIYPDFLPLPGECTPPTLGLTLILWEATTASRSPDRMMIVVADVGTANFSLDFDPFGGGNALPAVAVYIEAPDKLWLAGSGSLTSQVSPGSQACSAPLPPFAKSGSCNIATFSESGTIGFEELTFGGSSAPTARNVVIPPQTLRGILLDITETTPIQFPAAP